MCRRSDVVVLALAFTTPAMAAPDQAPSSPDRDVADVANEVVVPGGLTAEAVAARAAATSFDAAARRSELVRAAADVDRAMAAYLPRLTTTARYARLSNIPKSELGNLLVAPGVGPGPVPAGAQLVNAPLSLPVLLNQYTLQASLSIPISDYFLRVGPSVAAARQAERAAASNERVARRRAGTDGRLAYYSWVQAKLQTTVAEQSLAQSRAHLADVGVAEAAGVATQADLLAVQAQVAASVVLVESYQSLTRVGEERIRIAMHQGGPTPFAVGEDVRAAPPPLDARTAASSLALHAFAARPELAALDAQIAALKKKVAVERAGYLPRLDGFADAQYSNPNSRIFPAKDEFHGTWDVGAMLSWTVSDIPGAAASTKGATADVVTLTAQRHALEDSIRLEVTDSYEKAVEADAAVGPAEERVVAAEEAYRVRHELFKNGRATSVELTDAETELLRARTDALNTHVNQRVARVRLAYAVGS